MKSFNKHSLNFLEHNFYAITVSQITLVTTYLYILTTMESLPWIVYGMYTMLTIKILSSILFYNLMQDSWAGGMYSETLIPFKYMAIFMLVYFANAVFFLGVQFELGKSILCVEVMWNIILTLMFMAATPLN